MNRLEEYIRKNREELDQHTPSPEIWKGIRRGMERGRTYYIRWFSAAAMIIVIFATAALFYIGERRNNASTLSRNINARLIKKNTLLNETEIYYNTQVNSLYQQASPLLTQYPGIEKEFASDMAHIDSICAEIKSDLKDNISNQEVIEALINNYRLKIRILEDMLDLINKEQTSPVKNEDYEL
jgi:hypothetical protein